MKKNILLTLGLSSIIVLTVIKLLNYFNLAYMYAFGFIFILLLAGTMYFIYKALVLGNKKHLKFSFIFSLAFGLFNTVGIFLNLTNVGYNVQFSVGTIGFALLLALSQTIIMTAIITNVAYFFIDGEASKRVKVNHFKTSLKNERIVFWGTTGLVVVVFFMWWLSLYPGVMTSDSMFQVQQALGYNPWTNHHPVVHTFIVFVFMSIGNVLGFSMRGLGLFTLFQLILFAFLIGYMAKFLFKRGVSIIVVGCLVALFIFNPIHGVYSVTVWKDVIFAIIFCFFTIQVIKITEMHASYFTLSNSLQLALLAFLISTMRNNGFYVVLLSTPVIIFMSQGFRKQVSIVLCSSLISAFLLTGPIYNALGIISGSTREALSIPLQQIARISRDHGDSLTDEQIDQINLFLDFETIRNTYYPIVSDNVKNTFKDDNFSEHKGEFVKLWLSLVVQYPVTATEATAMNTFRYWSIPNDYWVLEEGIYLNEIGIQQQPKIDTGKKILEKWNLNRNKPIVSDVYSLGIYIWLIIVLAYIYVKRMNYQYMIVLLPLALLWLTNIASPVNGEYRYMYALVITLPFLMSYLFKPSKRM